MGDRRLSDCGRAVRLGGGFLEMRRLSQESAQSLSAFQRDLANIFSVFRSSAFACFSTARSGKSWRCYRLKAS